MYEYEIDQCDISNHEKLIQFRLKRERWLNQLDGSDFHSIWRQLHELFWNDTVFRVVNQARKIAATNPQPDVGFNAAVSRLFDVGFITTQVTSIRRLTEKKPDDAKKAVISLRSVLDDIQENLKLITRENYVSFDGLPYDPIPLEKAWLEKAAAKKHSTAEWLDTKGPNAWSQSKMVHKHFDELSGTSSFNRNRNDQIQPFIINRLIDKLKSCEDVCKYTDKFIAHGADPNNRTALSDEQKGITLACLDDCYKALYQVAYYTTGALLWKGSYGAVPVPQYDHLENLDKKWISTEALDQAHQTWEERTKEIENWSRGDWLEKVHLS